jgi:uncharacterized protein YukE
MLLFLAYGIMAEALAQLAQQVEAIWQVQDQAHQTADDLKAKWTGDDADQFQQVVANDVLPKMEQLISTVISFGQQLQQVQDRIT